MVSKSPALMTELRTLHKFVTTLGITIQARYLPSAVNRFADLLSRLKTLADWRINSTPLQSLLQQFKPGIDRFADQTSSICARFNSIHPLPWNRSRGRPLPAMGTRSKLLEPTNQAITSSCGKDLTRGRHRNISHTLLAGPVLVRPTQIPLPPSHYLRSSRSLPTTSVGPTRYQTTTLENDCMGTLNAGVSVCRKPSRPLS
jgi:hypothetical protein